MNYLLLIIIRLISFLPISILKKCTFLLNLINRFLFKYRYKVIYNNITNAFPLKSDSEISNIIKEFYDYFFNLIAEIIKTISANQLFIHDRVSIVNPELLENILNKNKSVILLSGHFNNWEWLGAKISLSYSQQFIAIYKRLNSSSFNNLFITFREKFGGKVVSIEESIRYIIKREKESKIIGIIGDQNPIVTKSTDWFNFFNRPVPVFMGAEQIAKKFNYPVLFCNMKRNDNHNYSITFEVIELYPQKTVRGEITKVYFNLLEKQIKKEPTQWLWSHRRWRHKI